MLNRLTVAFVTVQSKGADLCHLDVTEKTSGRERVSGVYEVKK